MARLIESLRRVSRSHRARRFSAIGLATVVTCGAVLWFSPLLAVREIRIVGNETIARQYLADTARVPLGKPLLRVDTDAVAARVRALPTVASARVQRTFPSSVTVIVQERHPVLYYESAQGAHLLDATGFEYAVGRPPGGVPRLKADHPNPRDPITRGAVAVLAALPAAVRAQVREVVAHSAENISLNLRDGRTVLWGSALDTERKAAVVGPLLTRPGDVFDVSSPSLVTVR